MISTVVMRWFSRASQWKVYRGHLLPAPPARPPASLSLFEKLSSSNMPANAPKLTSKELTQRWGLLSEEEKKRYKELSLKQQQEYKKQLKEYNEKYITKLKPLPNAYVRFIQHKYRQAKEKNAKTEENRANFKQLASEWNSLSAEDKAKYQLSAEEKEKLKSELEPYRIPMLKHGQQHTHEQIEAHRSKVNEFCERHGINREELYELLKEEEAAEKEKQTEESKEKKPKKKERSTAQKSKKEEGGSYQQQHQQWPHQKPQEVSRSQAPESEAPTNAKQLHQQDTNPTSAKTESLKSTIKEFLD